MSGRSALAGLDHQRGSGALHRLPCWKTRRPRYSDPGGGREQQRHLLVAGPVRHVFQDSGCHWPNARAYVCRRGHERRGAVHAYRLVSAAAIATGRRRGGVMTACGHRRHPRVGSPPDTAFTEVERAGSFTLQPAHSRPGVSKNRPHRVQTRMVAGFILASRRFRFFSSAACFLARSRAACRPAARFLPRSRDACPAITGRPRSRSGSGSWRAFRRWAEQWLVDGRVRCRRRRRRSRWRSASAQGDWRSADPLRGPYAVDVRRTSIVSHAGCSSIETCRTVDACHALPALCGRDALGVQVAGDAGEALRGDSCRRDARGNVGGEGPGSPRHHTFGLPLRHPLRVADRSAPQR